MGMSTKTKVLLAVVGFLFYAIRARDKKHVDSENFGLLS